MYCVGKVILLKDLHNLSQALNSDTGDLDEVVSLLQNQPGSTVEIVTDDKKTLRALFFQVLFT